MAFIVVVFLIGGVDLKWGIWAGESSYSSDVLGMEYMTLSYASRTSYL